MADYANLKDNVAIVTGAGSGIGRAIALELACAGASVVVAGTNVVDPSQADTELDAVVKQIQTIGSKALKIKADARESKDVSNIVQKTIEHFDRIDILVNNAGGSLEAFRDFTELSESSWDAHISQNLKTCFLCTKAVAPIMMEQKKGNIISMASITAIVGGTKRVPYAAAKAGIMNVTKTLAIEWAPYGIRVNCIVPGFIETAGAHKLRSVENLAQIAARIPLKRLGLPEDIANAARYLASDASDYITGQAIIVDGGWSNSLAEYF